MKKYMLLTMIAIVLMLSACSSQTPAKTFVIGGIPDQNVSELSQRFDDLAAYLAEETGLEVVYTSSADYAALVTAFGRGDVQMAWFGGLTGVQARALVEGSEAIAQRPRDEQFESVFIVNKAVGAATLLDLKGLSFTFGSESSTSGHLMPRYFMMEAGLDLATDLNGEPNYSGSHDTTWTLVESGAFDAGALNIAVWEKAVEEGKVDLDKVEAFYTTPTYYDYNWTINNVDETYGEGTAAKVQEALLALGEKNPELMALFQDESFIATNNSNYDAIKQVAQELGIIE